MQADKKERKRDEKKSVKDRKETEKEEKNKELILGDDKIILRKIKGKRRHKQKRFTKGNKRQRSTRL